MSTKLRPLPLALAVANRAFFNFSNQWLAGLRPQLILETDRDGQIWVSSRVVAGDVPTHSKLVLRRDAEERVNPHCQAGEAGHRPHHRRHGPARQRRRLRRQAERAAAAERAEQAAEKAEPAVKTVENAENVILPDAVKAAQSPTHHPT